MERLNLKATQRQVAEYYRALEQFDSLNVSHETAVRSAFQNLLDYCCGRVGLKLVPEWPVRRAGRHALRVDGALVDQYRLAHGFWEAKDRADDLRREIKKKLEAGYPTSNTLFQTPERAILWQNDREVLEADLTDRDALVRTLTHFFEYQRPQYDEWEQAVEDFQTEVPELGRALTELIERERRQNARFREAFTGFYELCRQSVNPNLSEQAVEEMLIQHLLTERIFRTVFRNPDFTRRNVIAAEIEKVIDALTSQAFSREQFLARFDHFYRAVETTAATIADYTQKQEFLNAVYEKFFQGFSVKVADTHGIVYTPQPIVSFMVRSVEEILRAEFGKSLGSPGVHILDPFTGTGNFVVRVMQEIKRTALADKYRRELHCNEVMLLPYYIASMNIEHEFYELTGAYETFEGVCLVDTFELAEARQASFFTTANMARVERQKRSPIFVIIGNPPYNAWQVNENDNNKNRKYKVMDRRVAETYAKDSKATLVNSLSDPYVKAIRWASDRILQNGEGIVAFVTNNSFVDNLAFDGVRKHLEQDFDSIYVLDLGGNVRKNPKLSGTTHNVFGIQVGVSVNIFVRRQINSRQSRAKIFYARADEFWRKEQKYAYLNEKQHVGHIEWQELQPDAKHNWLTEGMREDFDGFIPVGTKEGKQAKRANAGTIFTTYSRGLSTSRDEWVYDFSRDDLERKVIGLIQNYNLEVARFSEAKKVADVDDFVNNNPGFLKWTNRLKDALKQQKKLQFKREQVRQSLYRPFTTQFLYFDSLLIHRRYQQHITFPTSSSEEENLALCVSDIGFRSPYSVMVTNKLPELHLCASTDTFQVFPYYIYDEDGTDRRENITDWALGQFREEYGDASITKWDIFHYVYAVLHHPVYRERYAANLKRELPRIPFAPDFRAFAAAGARLAGLHVNYETQTEYPLERVENPQAPLDWRVERMRLSKDRRALVYNEFLTLSGIPTEAFEYRLGNRSALEWVVDQYQVTTDRRSGITNDPNRPEDPQYIVRLVGQVITVSLETIRLVRALPELGV